MTKKEYKKLHGQLDVLVADWIEKTKSLPSLHSVLSLMVWTSKRAGIYGKNQKRKTGSEPLIKSDKE
jgi:hypothetical protein